MEYDFKLKDRQLQIQGEIAKEQIRVEAQTEIAMGQNYAKIQVADTTGEAKVISTDLAGQHATIKQTVANQSKSYNKD